MRFGENRKTFEILNTEFDDVDPSISNNGNIYFESNREGEWNIYVSKFVQGKNYPPIKLDTPINTTYTDARPFISPDESYIIFQSDREGPKGYMKIFISFNNNGKWSDPLGLPNNINSGQGDFAPYISPDGKYFFFASFRGYEKNIFKNKTYEELIELYKSPLNGYSAIYWIDAGFIKNIMPK